LATFTEKMRRLDRIRLTLKRKFGDQPKPMVTHPVEHALRTILAEEAGQAQVEDAIGRMRAQFADWNDLRVSRPREIRETLGSDFPRRGHKARVIPRLLDQVFKHHNSMVWDFLETMGKVETRAYFESLEEVRPFVAATLARDCAGAHAFPVDHDVARVLGRLGILDPDEQSDVEMQAYLERGVKSTRAYEVHQLVRRLAEKLCLVEEPLCRRCPLKDGCPSAMLAPKKKAKKKTAPKRKRKKARRKAPKKAPKRRKKRTAKGRKRTARAKKK